MQCGNCGEEVRSPVWVVYADEGFAGKQLEPMPLHQKCFERDEVVDVAEWVDDPDHPEFSEDNRVMKLKKSRARRYRKVGAPDG